MRRKIKIIDLFAGVGGLSYGFSKDKRFKIIAANEILSTMALAYSLNHPTVKMYTCDIKDFNRKKVMSDLGVAAGKIDIIVGGPPCQAYSTVGMRKKGDQRGELFQEYYRLLKEFQPKFFLYENVKGLLSMRGGKLLDTIIGLFESLGYCVKQELLNAIDFGVPQIRERVIVTGTKLNTEFQYPSPTHFKTKSRPTLFADSMQTYLTLEDAISDLPLINSGDESFEYASEAQNNYQRMLRNSAPKRLMDHNAPKNNQKMVELMAKLPDGGTPMDLPERLRPKSGFKNTYCKLWWRRPCTTITRNLSTPSSSRCIHPRVARPLTTREGARIQSFPDEYVFYGSRTDRNLQIGNAVPPILSTALTESIFAHLSDAGL